MADAVGNERLKLVANALNATAVAILTAGVFVPIAYTIYGLGTPPRNSDFLFDLPVVCICMTIILHLAGLAVLGGLDDDQQ